MLWQTSLRCTFQNQCLRVYVMALSLPLTWWNNHDNVLSKHVTLSGGNPVHFFLFSDVSAASVRVSNHLLWTAPMNTSFRYSMSHAYCWTWCWGSAAINFSGIQSWVLLKLHTTIAPAYESLLLVWLMALVIGLCESQLWVIVRVPIFSVNMLIPSPTVEEANDLGCLWRFWTVCSVFWSHRSWQNWTGSMRPSLALSSLCVRQARAVLRFCLS